MPNYWDVDPGTPEGAAYLRAIRNRLGAGPDKAALPQTGDIDAAYGKAMSDKMVEGQRFTGEMGLGNARLALGKDRLALQGDENALRARMGMGDIQLKRMNLDLRRRELDSNRSQNRLSTALAVGNLGVSGYRGYKSSQQNADLLKKIEDYGASIDPNRNPDAYGAYLIGLASLQNFGG